MMGLIFWLLLFFAIVSMIFRFVLVMAYVTPERYMAYYEGLLKSASSLKRMVGLLMRFHYTNKVSIGLILLTLSLIGKIFVER